MDGTNVAPIRAVYTWKQMKVFRDLFNDAKADIIFGRWITHVGIEAAVNRWCTGRDSTGGLARDIISLAINDNAQR